MNFGQHWRTEGIAEVDCSILVPRALLREIMEREHSDYVADAIAHPEPGEPYEQAQRERGWPSVPEMLDDPELLRMSADWYHLDLLAAWLGDDWPEGGPTAARPWFVLNTAVFEGLEGDLLRFGGRARQAGTMDVRYQDV